MKYEDHYLETTIYSMFKGKSYDYKTIREGEIFLSYPKCFNDPFDCAIFIDKKAFEREFLIIKLGADLVAKIHFDDIMEKMHFYEQCKQFVPNVPLPEDFAIFDTFQTSNLRLECDELYKKYVEALNDIKNEYGVACFTTNKPENNMVMWAHYANNYKGFCCEFEIDFYNIGHEHDTKNTYRFAPYFSNVDYDIFSKNNFIDVLKLLSCKPDDLKFDTYVREFIEASFYKKHKQWEYENEYRLVINKNNNSFEKTLETPVGFRIKFPYLSKVYIHTDHIKYKNGIKRISNKLNKDIICLRESPQGVKLVEDKTLTHKYNDHRTLTHILSGYNETQILTTKDELPF